MKSKRKIIIGLFILFFVLLGSTLYTSYSVNTEVEAVVVKSVTPVYDENSGVVVTHDNATFNDKNQTVKYNVVIENTQDFDVKISDINLSTPTEEFLKYEVENIEDDVLEANSTKEIVVSFETTGIKGWGRNFSDELTTNISFEKVSKQEEDNETDTENGSDKNNKEEATTESKPIAPAQNVEELLENTKEIEAKSITANTIEFKDDFIIEKGEKIAVWIYSEPIFLGYFDAIVEKDIKKLEGLEAALNKIEIEPGEHNIALVTESDEILGYVKVFITNDKKILNKKPEEDNDKRNETIENPYTSDNKLLIVLIGATALTGLTLVVVSKNKLAKYMVIIILLGSTITPTKAESPIELPITFNISFKSQNVMKDNNCIYNEHNDTLNECVDYWQYAPQIKNFYIDNEITEIEEYEYKFDVTESQNKRVIAYLVNSKNDSVCYDFEWEDAICYDLYLQADGIIYPNSDSSNYFAFMMVLDNIDNIEGFATEKVVDMNRMFMYTGMESEIFTLDVSNFDTSNVTDMSYMFSGTGYNSTNFTLDVSNFDTSKVTDMSSMFSDVGSSSSSFTLDVSNFDTNNVTDMSYMFSGTGYNSTNFTLDVSNFDTSNVTDMSYMFSGIGYSNKNFTLDVSNFDTSNVTDMSNMFSSIGYNSTNFTLDVSNFDTNNVTNMSRMFFQIGYNSETLTLDISNFDVSNVINMSNMFYGIGYNTETLTLDVGNFDASNVTNINYMFRYIGYKSKNFTLNVSNFNVSNVTSAKEMFAGAGYYSENFIFNISEFNSGDIIDMSYMFYNVGYNSENLALNVSNFNATKVTDMSYMFYNVGNNSKNLSLNVSNFNATKVTDMSNMFRYAGFSSETLTLSLNNFDTNKVTDMNHMFFFTGYKSTEITLDLGDKFDTSNVTNMSSMFANAGHCSTDFTLDVSDFDTSNVTDMSSMFSNTGYYSTKLNTSITIRNPETLSYSQMLLGFVKKSGSSFIINYTSETSDLVDQMLANKYGNSNIIKGIQVD